MTLPTPDQEQSAKWDLVLLDMEARIEQVRQMKAVGGRRLAIEATSAIATVFLAGAAIGGLFVHLLEK